MTDHNEAMRLADFCDGNVLYHPAAALIRKQATELDTLRAEVERLRVDAERWREISAMTENAERSLLKLADENERLEERLRTASAAFQREQDRADAAEIRAETAHAAGRDQGLREAKEVCEAMSALVVKSNTSRGRTNSAAVFSSGLLDDCATAIEQLRGK